VLWVPDVLVSRMTDTVPDGSVRCGPLATLPDRLRRLVPGLGAGEAYLYRRGQGEFDEAVVR
jgi:hypothetical protein